MTGRERRLAEYHRLFEGFVATRHADNATQRAAFRAMDRAARRVDHPWTWRARLWLILRGWVR